MLHIILTMLLIQCCSEPILILILNVELRLVIKKFLCGYFKYLKIWTLAVICGIQLAVIYSLDVPGLTWEEVEILWKKSVMWSLELCCSMWHCHEEELRSKIRCSVGCLGYTICGQLCDAISQVSVWKVLRYCSLFSCPFVFGNCILPSHMCSWGWLSMVCWAEIIASLLNSICPNLSMYSVGQKK